MVQNAVGRAWQRAGPVVVALVAWGLLACESGGGASAPSPVPDSASLAEVADPGDVVAETLPPSTPETTDDAAITPDSVEDVPSQAGPDVTAHDIPPDLPADPDVPTPGPDAQVEEDVAPTCTPVPADFVCGLRQTEAEAYDAYALEGLVVPSDDARLRWFIDRVQEDGGACGAVNLAAYDPRVDRFLVVQEAHPIECACRTRYTLQDCETQTLVDIENEYCAHGRTAAPCEEGSAENLYTWVVHMGYPAAETAVIRSRVVTSLDPNCFAWSPATCCMNDGRCQP